MRLISRARRIKVMDTHMHTHIHTYTHTRTRMAMHNAKKAEKHRRIINQSSRSAFVATAGLERVRVDKGTAAHGRF